VLKNPFNELLAIKLAPSKTDRLFGVLVIALGLGEPGEEGLGRLAHLLAGWEIDVFLAGFGAPFSEHLFTDDILIVENHEDLRRQIIDLWVLFASDPNEAFHSSEKSLLMFLGANHLYDVSKYSCI